MPDRRSDRLKRPQSGSHLHGALTQRSPNAFYELGIRYAAERPVVHIARDGTELPFDNAGQRTIFVDLGKWESIVACRTAVAAAVRQITSPGFKLSNPITQANASFRMRHSSDDRDEVILKLIDQIDALSRRLGQIESRSGGDDLDKFERFLMDRDPTLGSVEDLAARAYLRILGQRDMYRKTEKRPALDLLGSSDDSSRGAKLNAEPVNYGTCSRT